TFTPRELSFQSCKRCFQVLRQDARLAEQRHEIGIGTPTWDDMHVDVMFNACACNAALIDADIESFGRIGVVQGFECALQQTHHIKENGRWYGFNRRNVAIGCDQEMAVIIWINVHHDIGMVTAVQDIRDTILLDRGLLAKNASALMIGFFDECEAPGGPQLFHRGSIRWPAQRARSSATSSSYRLP